MGAGTRLDRLNSLYGTALDRAQARLGSAQSRADLVARDRERIAALGAEYRRGLGGTTAVSAAHLKHLGAFVGTLDAGAAVYDAELRRRLQVRDEAHSQWLLARRRARSMEKLTERAGLRARAVERRSEQRLADERPHQMPAGSAR